MMLIFVTNQQGQWKFMVLSFVAALASLRMVCVIDGHYVIYHMVGVYIHMYCKSKKTNQAVEMLLKFHLCSSTA